MRPPGPLEPEWAKPNAVVHTMLTSLAQIQARVLDFAHQLEQEELYARLPVKTGAEDATIERATNAERRAAVLDAEMTRLRTESRLPSTRSLEIMNEVKQQRDTLQAELLTERERAGRLDAHLKILHKEAHDAISRLKSQHDQLQRENDLLASRVRDMEAQLQRANESLETWEKVGAESMSIVARNKFLQTENGALRAEIERLRPPSADADPLTLLMIDRVKALHWLAVYESRAGRKVTGQFLSSYDTQQILVAAQYQAFAARRDYYFRMRGPNDPKPEWISEDRLLDAHSEEKVHGDEQFKNDYIFSRLTSARRQAGENP